MEAAATPSSENSSDGEAAGTSEVSSYEQQRLARIRENKARFEALGLPHLASSLLRSSPTPKSAGTNKGKTKKKKKNQDDDEEYRPSDDDDGRGGESVGDGESEEEEGAEADAGPSSSSRRKGKKKSSSKAKVLSKRKLEFDQHDDEALRQAIALSLAETAKDSVVFQSSDRVEVGASARKRKEKASTQETAGRTKSRKMSKSRVQLTEDEVVAYFFSFDEAGKGHISIQDLRRMVLAHDFNWTEMEIASMIHSFDSDGDGKLSLDDFKSIVSRCNMLQEESRG